MKFRNKDLAEITGLSTGRISQLLENGQLVADKNGLFNLFDPVNMGFLKSREIDINSLSEDSKDFDIGEFSNITLPEIIKESMPHDGKNLSPKTWELLWRCVENARLDKAAGIDSFTKEAEIFEAHSGVPYRYAHLNLKSAILRMIKDEGYLSRPPHWREIYLQMKAIFA
jgi:hypothetical protein